MKFYMDQVRKIANLMSEIFVRGCKSKIFWVRIATLLFVDEPAYILEGNTMRSSAQSIVADIGNKILRAG